VADNEKIDALEAEIEALRELRKEELSSLSGPDKWDNEQVKEYTSDIKDLTEKLKEHTKAQEEATKAQEESTKAQDSFTAALGNTITTFTGVTSGSETLIGSFFKLRAEVRKGDKEAEKFEKSLNKMFESLNVGASIMSKVIQSTLFMATAHDAALASFNKASGAAGHYNNELLALERTNRIHGISTAELGESYSALMGNLSGFGVMAESERMRLGELGAQYAKIGVSGADFAGSLETMTRGLGMSTSAASGMVEESMHLAQALGKDVGSVISELNQTLPKLASYGDDLTHIFKDLERQAQRTGLEVGELVDIAGRYRTFDSAATAAGNLNAVIGTQLFSSMGMLEAQLEGPTELVDYIAENLSNSIGDWDSLNTFYKDALANAANMSVLEMSNLMNRRNMTVEDREREATMAKTMATARSMMEELAILAAEFAVSVQPIFEMFKGIVSAASRLLQWGSDMGGVVGQLTVLFGILLVGTFVKGIAKGLIYNAVLAGQIPILASIAAAYRAIAVAKRSGGGAGGVGAGPLKADGTPDMRFKANRNATPASGGGGFMSMLGPKGMGATRGARFMSGLKMGGMLSVLGMGAEIAAGGDKTEAVGAGIGGALGAGVGSLLGPLGTLAGGYLGSKAGRWLGGLEFHEGGGVGKGKYGDVPATLQSGEGVIPINKTPAAENLSNMVAEKSSAANDNKAVVAAVQALGQKLDAVVTALNASGDFVLQVGDEKFGRVINKHFYQPGYQRIDIKKAAH
jgi:hypothetical protein